MQLAASKTSLSDSIGITSPPDQPMLDSAYLDQTAYVVGVENILSLAAEFSPERKGEFESLEEFAERARYKGDESIIIQGAQSGFRYNADSERWSIRLQVSSDSVYNAIGLDGQNLPKFIRRPTIEVARLNDQPSSFVGTNAFGVQVRVTRRSGTIAELFVLNDEGFRGLNEETWKLHATLSFPMDRATAKRLSGDLALAFKVDIDSTITRLEGKESSGATIRIPSQRNYDIDRIPVVIKSIHAVDSTTKKSLAKWDVSSSSSVYE